MRVGSLVVCVDNSNIGKNAKPLKLNEIYTVRELIPYPDGKLGVILEEVVNAVDCYNIEYRYKPERFTDLLEPIDNIEEHINRNSWKEVEPVWR